MLRIRNHFEKEIEYKSEEGEVNKGGKVHEKKKSTTVHSHCFIQTSCLLFQFT